MRYVLEEFMLNCRDLLSMSLETLKTGFSKLRRIHYSQYFSLVVVWFIVLILVLMGI